MSTSAAGTTFTLRTPSHIKSCHVTGSWDKYGKRYQMNVDTAAGPGYWTLTLKFGASMTPARYFYYFILDGYFESHNPNEQSCVEPTRNLTLNIMDYGMPSSPASTTSSRSSRRSSPTSSTSSRSPASSVRSSKRSGGVYDLPSPLEDQPYYHSKAHPSIPTGSRRTPSPRRQHRELSHLVHPKPRNPMAAHKLTLDTHYRTSVISNAATTSPVSSRSSSSCSGSSFSSGGSSPVTPLCQCDEFEVDTRGHYCEEYGEYYSDEEEEYEYRYARAPAPKDSKLDSDLAYRLERGLRM